MVHVAVGVILCGSALATSENPYVSIVQRNIFALHEPAPAQPPPAPAPVAADPSELMLTGIADFRTAKWALLTRTERGKTPQRYTLAVGEKQDTLEVLEIDAESSTVRVRHGSTEVVLSFDTHGPPNPAKVEDLGRKYVQQAKPFVDEHTRAHALREKREAERRELERAAAEAELISRQISTHMDEPRL